MEPAWKSATAPSVGFRAHLFPYGIFPHTTRPSKNSDCSQTMLGRKHYKLFQYAMEANQAWEVEEPVCGQESERPSFVAMSSLGEL